MRCLHVQPNRFRFQMQLLKSLGYKGCSVSEAATALQSKRSNKLVGLTFDDGYQNFFHEALPILKKLDFSATVYCVSNLIGKSNEWDESTGITKNPLMTYSQIKECTKAGIEIGCHSATHKSLIEQECDLNHEISSAKSELQNRFETEVSSFCYPYGHFNETVLDVVAASGFSSATTMIRSRARDTDGLLSLPRIPITWHTLPHLFLIKLLTTYEDSRRTA